MAIELVTQYTGLVDEKFTSESKKSLVTNEDFKWDGAHAIKVYSIGTTTMNDYSRNKEGGNRYGTPTDLTATTQTMTLTKDRSFTSIIDKLDRDETGNALEAGSALERQIREVVIPEVDAYTYGVMCTKAGTKATAVGITTSNIYDLITAANTVLDEAEVPPEERVLIVTPPIHKIMKQCDDITMNTDIGNDLRIKGVVSNLDGLLVERVPSKRLPAGFGFMIAHKSATVAPVKLSEYKAHEDPPGVSGSLLEGRVVYDAFVLDNKAKGIYYQPQPVV